MITKVGFKNVRVFKELQEFDINKLTVLTGTNNSGKSTIQKMLLLFSKNFNKKKNGVLDIGSIDFSNDFEITGDFNCNVNYESKEKELVFSFDFKDSFHGELKALLYYKKSLKSEKGILNRITILKGELIINDYININKGNNYLHWENNIKSHKNIIDYTYNLLEELKNNNLLVKKLQIIDEKLHNSIKLTKEEIKIVKDFENKNIFFNSEKVTDDMIESPYYHNPYGWRIFDNYAGGIYTIKTIFDVYKIKNIYELNNKSFFLNWHGITLPSKLYEQVINNKIFTKQNLSNDEQIILDILIKNEICTNELFTEAYNKFIYNCIAQCLSRNELDCRGSNDFDDFDDEIPNIDRLKIRWMSVNYPFKENCVISQLILKEYPHKGTIDDPGSAFDKILHDIWHLANSPLNSFLTDLNGFINSLYLSYYDKTIKRHYLFNDKNITNNPFLEFGIKCINLKKEDKQLELSYINKWIKKLEIADELIVEPIKINTETIGISYFLKNKKQLIPLGNSGLGINNIILLLINIQLSNHTDRIIALEEPEANLHPAYQSLLAEILIDQETKAKFIVETHSEYLIRKLQNLVADNIISKNKISIYYFNNPQNKDYKKSIVKILNINDDGSMDDEFGTGFFDETIKLVKHLLRIKKYQIN